MQYLLYLLALSILPSAIWSQTSSIDGTWINANTYLSYTFKNGQLTYSTKQEKVYSDFNYTLIREEIQVYKDDELQMTLEIISNENNILKLFDSTTGQKITLYKIDPTIIDHKEDLAQGFIIKQSESQVLCYHPKHGVLDIRGNQFFQDRKGWEIRTTNQSLTIARERYLDYLLVNGNGKEYTALAYGSDMQLRSIDKMQEQAFDQRLIGCWTGQEIFKMEDGEIANIINWELEINAKGHVQLKVSDQAHEPSEEKLRLLNLPGTDYLILEDRAIGIVILRARALTNQALDLGVLPGNNGFFTEKNIQPRMRLTKLLGCK